MPPQVGVTHDIVIYLSSTLQLGVTLKPFTYNVSHLPGFIPRMGVGDPTGTDTNRWHSFVQQSFSQGAGQYFWSSPHANGAFAESNMMDISRPVAVISGISVRDDPSWAFGQNLIPVGNVRSAIAPMSTSGGVDNLYTRFSTAYPVSIIDVSNKPLLVHNVSALTFTGAFGHPDPWISGIPTAALEGGFWQTITNFSIPSPARSVVQFSNTLVVACMNRALRVYGGPVSGTTGLPATTTPSYNTGSDIVIVYDNKLWRADKGRVAYLRPGYTSNPAVWSDYYYVGNSEDPISNAAEFAGRLYFGKDDGLYVFDTGRTYVIQSYDQDRSNFNFRLMVPFKGALYYNVRNSLYRLTSGGMIEQIRTPWTEGYISDGAATNDELYFITREKGTRTRVWIFDAEYGGVRQWFSTSSFADRGWLPEYIDTVRGHVFLSPTYLTSAVNVIVNTGDGTVSRTRSVPVIASPRKQIQGNQWSGDSFLVTSQFDFGLPNVDKQFNRLVIDARIDDAQLVEVLYSKSETVKVVPVSGTISEYPENIFFPIRVEDNIRIVADQTNPYAWTSIRQGDPLDLTAGGWLTGQRPSRRIVACYHGNMSGEQHDMRYAFKLEQPYTHGIITVSPTAYSGVTLWYSNTVYAGLMEYGFTTVPLGAMVGSFPGTISVNYHSLPGVVALDFDFTLSKGLAISASPHPSGITGATVTGFYYVINDVNGVQPLIEPGPSFEGSWVHLGYLTGTGNPKQYELSMRDVRTRGIMLQFRSVGDRAIHEITKYEIEYIPVGPKYRSITGVAMALNAIHTLDGAIENSAMFIKAALFSCATGQEPYVVAIPYPTVGETIYAQVSIRAPGAQAPMLSYPGDIESEIAIQIDEM